MAIQRIPSPTTQSKASFAARLFSFERLLVAALAGAAASFVARVVGALSPGLPQSSVLESAHVPFFEHMILAGWVALLFLFGGRTLDKSAARYPGVVVAAIIILTVGAAMTQWFFPNY